uniref:U-actitoxin-Avt1 n=1 Tax=Aulactinia veratra TaxID=1730095 RepID=UTX1_AULVR
MNSKAIISVFLIMLVVVSCTQATYETEDDDEPGPRHSEKRSCARGCGGDSDCPCPGWHCPSPGGRCEP